MRLAVILVAIVAIGMGATNAALTGSETGDLRSQLAQARAQFTQQERNDRQAQVSLSRELIRAEQALTAAEARIGGTHRDLITCADWQGLVLPVTGTDSFGGQISGSASAPALPQHCINQ